MHACLTERVDSRVLELKTACDVISEILHLSIEVFDIRFNAINIIRKGLD